MIITRGTLKALIADLIPKHINADCSQQEIKELIDNIYNNHIKRLDLTQLNVLTLTNFGYSTELGIWCFLNIKLNNEPLKMFMIASKKMVDNEF